MTAVEKRVLRCIWLRKEWSCYQNCPTQELSYTVVISGLVGRSFIIQPAKDGEMFANCWCKSTIVSRLLLRIVVGVHCTSLVRIIKKNQCGTTSLYHPYILVALHYIWPVLGSLVQQLRYSFKLMLSTPLKWINIDSFAWKYCATTPMVCSKSF